MDITEKKQDGVLIFSLEGELMGGENAIDFQNRIYEAIKEDDVSIIIDMDHVQWMNSSGLGMLMGALTTLRSSGGDLKLVNVSDRVKRPIEITKLDSVLQIYNSLKDAVDSFGEE